MSVGVYMDAATDPLQRRVVVPGEEPIELQFTAPEGEHTFLVRFDYDDPQLRRSDERPWEIARWVSDTVQVVSGEAVPLEIGEYVYADDDGDGFSNLQELVARTDPADATDPGTALPRGSPDGIWRAAAGVPGEPFAIVHGGEAFMVIEDLLYVGRNGGQAQGGDVVEVDVYGPGGGRLASGVPIELRRAAADRLIVTGEDGFGDPVELHADGSYRRSTTLGAIARNWQLSLPAGHVLGFPIDGNGAVSGAADTAGCVYNGAFSVPDPAYNVYRVDLEVSAAVAGACVPGNFSGYATLASDDALHVIVANESHALALHFPGSEASRETTVTIWAVGKDGRILRRRDGAWQVVVQAPKGLHGIACPAPDACWAVGEKDRGRATILRWNGDEWSNNGFFNDTPDQDLYAIACVSQDDCWAVGKDAGRRANIVRWDGSSWSSAGFVNDAADKDLYAIACAATDDCWAVGEDHRRSAFIVRWNGSVWSQAGFLNATPGKDLRGIACPARDDCWAVGEAERGSAIIARGDGASWVVAESDTPNRTLASVACLSSSRCWAVGSRGTVVRRDGTAWQAAAAGSGLPSEDLTAIHCAAGRCWAVGKKGVVVQLRAGAVWTRHDAGGDDLRGVFVLPR